jgi:hypothetical protein
MSDPQTADNPVGYRRATPEEIEVSRLQLIEGNRQMMEAIKPYGIKLHPRIAAWRKERGLS